MGRGSALCDALRTTAPVSDLGFVNLVAPVVGGRQTGRGTDRARDVHDAAADSTDQMVVVVADPVLEARRGPGGLNAPEKPFAHKDPEGVVDRLQRDGPYLGPDDVGDFVGREVRPTGECTQHGEPLRGDLDAALTKQIRLVGGHSGIIDRC